MLYVGQPYTTSSVREYYDALVIHDMYGLKQLVRKGDTVLLQSGGEENPYICQVHEVWRDVKTGESYFRGVWFYRTEDLPSSVVYPSTFNSKTGQRQYKNREERNMDLDKDKEHIFLSTEKFVNSAETILVKAVVMYSTDSKTARDWKIHLDDGIQEERNEVVEKFNISNTFYKTCNTLFRADYQYRANVADASKQVKDMHYVEKHTRHSKRREVRIFFFPSFFFLPFFFFSPPIHNTQHTTRTVEQWKSAFAILYSRCCLCYFSSFLFLYNFVSTTNNTKIDIANGKFSFCSFCSFCFKVTSL